MNKRTLEEASQLLTQLQADFQPVTATARGLDLWTYLGGPWQHQRTFPYI